MRGLRATTQTTRKTRSVLTRALLTLCGLVAALGAYTSTAQADVNTTTNGYGVATMSSCTVYVGDQANPDRYAIGDAHGRAGSARPRSGPHADCLHP
jgi:hypothetical protein